MALTSGGPLRVSAKVPVTLQGCFVAVILLFVPLKAISAAPGFRSPVFSAGTTAMGSVSEGSEMSDRETAGLRGPVKVCVEESVGSPGSKSSREYTLDGKLLTIRYDYADGPESIFTYTYDDAGRSLSITNNRNSDRTDFRYDEHGGVTEILTFDPKTIEGNRNAATTASAWDAPRSGMGVPMGGTATIVHDENRKPVELQVRGADGDVVARVVRSYNADGRISEERPTLENPAALFLERISPEERAQLSPVHVKAMNKAMATMSRGRGESGKVYSYDAQGRVTHLRETNFAFEKTTTILYNHHGDVEKINMTFGDNLAVLHSVSYSVDEEGNLTPGEASGATPEHLPLPTPEELHYGYQYDSYGNWTQQTTTQGSGSGTPAGERHRTLTYY
jgi:YD repeat-containing protein